MVGALALYVLFVGPRPDIAEAARTLRFNLKFVDALALTLPSLMLLFRLARPDAKPGTLALWLFAPLILLALAVVVELMVVPSSESLPRLVGHNMRYCTTMIPMMAAPILAALIAAMRAGAPQHPGWTGALAGAASAGNRGVSLRLALPGRFAALRRDLVSDCDPCLRRRRRARRTALSRLVNPFSRFAGEGGAKRRMRVTSYFFTSGSRIAFSWSSVSSPL